MKLISVLLLLCMSAFAGDATLTWNCNTEADLAGYKVYQGNAPGSYGPPAQASNTCTSGKVSYTITGLSNGTYYWVITAYDTSGNESIFSSEVSKVITDGGTTPPPQISASINFTTSTGPVATGFVNDSGAAFTAARGYGWNICCIDSRVRSINPDKTLDSFVFWSPNQGVNWVWEYVLANGTYLVSLAVGDAAGPAGPHKLIVEGIPLVNGVSTATNQFFTITDQPVTILDGKLTVQVGGGAGNTMWNYIVIRSNAPAPDTQAPAAPTGVVVN